MSCEAGLAQPRAGEQPAEAAADHDHLDLVRERRADEARRDVRVLQVVREPPGDVHVLVVGVRAQPLVALGAVTWPAARLDRNRGRKASGSSSWSDIMTASRWSIQAMGQEGRTCTPGATPSARGLRHGRAAGGDRGPRLVPRRDRHEDPVDVATEKRPTLRLDSQGTRAAGFAGCNQFAGHYTLAGVDEVKFGPLAVTKMYCADAQAIEDQYLAALGQRGALDARRGRAHAVERHRSGAAFPRADAHAKGSLMDLGLARQVGAHHGRLEGHRPRLRALVRGRGRERAARGALARRARARGARDRGEVRRRGRGARRRPARAGLGRAARRRGRARSTCW